jgi:hypothetical protein
MTPISDKMFLDPKGYRGEQNFSTLVQDSLPIDTTISKWSEFAIKIFFKINSPYCSMQMLS